MTHDSSSDDESGPSTTDIKMNYMSEEDEVANRPLGTAANKKMSTIEWFYRGQTTGQEQIVPAPFVSNDLTPLKVTQPVRLMDEKGNLLVRSVHEADNEDETPDVTVARWQSAVTGTVVDIKQFDWSKLGLDYTICLYGKRRTGKTHFIKALCYQLRRYFPAVIVFTKTKFNGDLLKIFPDAYVFNDMDEATLERILEAQKKRVQQVKSGPQPWVNARLLLVFDDVLSDRKNPRYNEMLRKMFFEGRHFWISMIITSQDSKGLPPALKQNTDLTIILPMQARRDRETISDNVLPFLWNDKDAREFLKQTMQLKHGFLAVVNCRGARPMEEQVYLGIITPEDYIPRYVMGSYACWRENIEQLTGLGFDYLATDTRFETWHMESHIPPTPKAPDRPDGMSRDPIEEKRRGRGSVPGLRKVISKDGHGRGQPPLPVEVHHNKLKFN